MNNDIPNLNTIIISNFKHSQTQPHHNLYFRIRGHSKLANQTHKFGAIIFTPYRFYDSVALIIIF